MGCRELLKSGKLGKISRIEQVRNSDKPYWYEYLKPDVQAADLDWKAFTKGRTKKAFDPILYSGWYGYWEFSQGPVPQWGVHFLDLVHFIAGLGIPEIVRVPGRRLHVEGRAPLHRAGPGAGALALSRRR